MFGDLLIEFLQASEVKTTHCVRLTNPTTLAFVKLSNGQAQYSFFDENSALRNLDESQLPKIPDTVSALHFGAISLIPEPCGTAYETMMANNLDKVISFDPIFDQALFMMKINIAHGSIAWLQWQIS